MSALNRRIHKPLLRLAFGAILVGMLLSSACAAPQRTMARNKVRLWADTLDSPDNVELLFEDIGVTRPDRRGCWAAYIDRVYGTDNPNSVVLSHYNQIFGASQDWLKNQIVASDYLAVYDHPDGSSVHISTDISLSFPQELDKHRTHFKTLFYVIVTWQSPEMRRECREY